jgi:hypothetical protein
MAKAELTRHTVTVEKVVKVEESRVNGVLLQLSPEEAFALRAILVNLPRHHRITEAIVEGIVRVLDLFAKEPEVDLKHIAETEIGQTTLSAEDDDDIPFRYSSCVVR